MFSINLNQDSLAFLSPQNAIECLITVNQVQVLNLHTNKLEGICKMLGTNLHSHISFKCFAGN